MLTKNQIKFIRSLEHKKNRREAGLFIAEGKKIVTELLGSSLKLHSIYGISSFFNHPLRNFDGEKFEVSESELKKISFLSQPNEALCIAEIPDFSPSFAELSGVLSLYLSNVRDPGNMGTIIRIADWFGIQQIFFSDGSVDPYNPKAVQATMGSIARVKFFNVEAAEVIRELKTCNAAFPVYGTLLGGRNIYNEKLSPDGLILLGNESEGLSPELQKIADVKLSIPSFGSAESLNVAVSAAIICSEFRRRKEG